MLVVDDHGATLHRLVQLLQAAGAIVIGVRTPQAAVGYALAARFDAVVVDLPIDDGSRLLRELRSSAAANICLVTAPVHRRLVDADYLIIRQYANVADVAARLGNRLRPNYFGRVPSLGASRATPSCQRRILLTPPHEDSPA